MKKLTKKQRTFKLLTHSARVMFEQKGVENVTFDDIAEHANVCRTTVFNHFPSGKDLLSALSTTEINDLINHCANSNFQGLELVRSLFDKIIEDTCKYPSVMTQLTTNYILQRGPVEGAMMLEKTVSENLSLEHQRKALPLLEKFSPAEAAAIIFGIYFGIVANSHINDKSFETAAMKERFTDTLDKLLF